MNRIYPDSRTTPGSDESCAAAASRQYGLISRAQALAAGMSKDKIHHRVATGRWELVLPRVYRVKGASPSWHQELMAACLWGGEGVAVSHRAAAALHNLSGFPSGIVEISTTNHLRTKRPSLLLHRVRHMSNEDMTVVSSIPVTTPTRTLIDLCRVAEPAQLEAALDDALRRRLTSIPRLRWALRREGSRGRSGTALLGRLLEERDGRPVPESVLETRLSRLLADSGLPHPERQLEIRDKGRLVARVDLAYPRARFAIEADGYVYHSSHAAWRRDRVRRNALTALGWRVLHVTWKDLNERPGDIVAEIGAGIAKTPDP